MTEEQAVTMIMWLERIANKLDTMDSRLSSIESNTNLTWDAQDVCNKLEDVREDLKSNNDRLKEIVDNTNN